MPAVLKKGVYICCPFALKTHIVIENMLRNVVCSFVEFLLAVLKLCPTESCANFFGPPDIHIVYKNKNKNIVCPAIITIEIA